MEEVEEIMEEEYPTARTIAGILCDHCENIQQVWTAIQQHVIGLLRQNKSYLRQYGRNVWAQVMLIPDKNQPVSDIKIGFFGTGNGTYGGDRPNAPVQLTCTVQTKLITDLLDESWSDTLYNEIFKELDPDASEHTPSTITVRGDDRIRTGYVASTYLDLLCF